jgi:hypothetical protein
VRRRQRFHIEQFPIRSLPAVKLLAIPGSHPSVFQSNIELNFTLWDPGASNAEQHCSGNDAALHLRNPESSNRYIHTHIVITLVEEFRAQLSGWLLSP